LRAVIAEELEVRLGSRGDIPARQSYVGSTPKADIGRDTSHPFPTVYQPPLQFDRQQMWLDVKLLANLGV